MSTGDDCGCGCGCGGGGGCGGQGSAAVWRAERLRLLPGRAGADPRSHHQPPRAEPDRLPGRHPRQLPGHHGGRAVRCRRARPARVAGAHPRRPLDRVPRLLGHRGGRADLLHRAHRQRGLPAHRHRAAVHPRAGPADRLPAAAWTGGLGLPGLHPPGQPGEGHRRRHPQERPGHERARPRPAGTSLRDLRRPVRPAAVEHPARPRDDPGYHHRGAAPGPGPGLAAGSDPGHQSGGPDGVLRKVTGKPAARGRRCPCRRSTPTLPPG